MSSDVYAAFVPDGQIEVAGRAGGPLADLTFVVKDVIDIQGEVTTAGNPTWGRERGPATSHAAAISRLLEAGATLKGKTITDEFAYGITGDNPHHGRPLNPAAPGCFSGGSSCGSAAAVAGQVCDFGLGTDTGGSIRIPASYCGLFGFRPTHGAVDAAGVLSLSPSFDTVGWLAREGPVLERVGRQVLPRSAVAPPPRRLLVARDSLELVDPLAVQEMGTAIERLASKWSSVAEVDLAGPTGDLAALQQAYSAVQRHQAWRTYGSWVERNASRLGASSASLFGLASKVSDAEASAAEQVLEAHRVWLSALLAGDAVLCLPSTPGPAPRIDTNPDSLSSARQRAIRLACPASAAGLPQVSLPLAAVDGLPVGVSLMGPPGSDRMLLGLAVEDRT